jgi:cysteinyl-tRNA synthetase
MNNLMIYNSLTRKKDEFVPLTQGFVGIYVCGPTVYGHSHIGHAKSYISFDVMVRYFRYLGFKVRYVQNITDVGHLLGDVNEGEDRILKTARLQQMEPMEVVESYMRSYFEDMDKLGLARPDISPRASGHVIEQIEMVKILLDKGFAYEVNGNVYFDVHKFPDYGKLSGRKLDDLESGVRISVQEEKRHPADFALWKKADPSHLMQWPSPWGNGYPGWHIECSCMSTKYLGETFDIHGGGLENIFPHHECEIAQSEGAFGKPFARYWIHNNMVTVDGSKMGRSLNNFINVKDALKKYSPLGIRYFVLMSHYRSTLDFTDDAITAAEKGLHRLHTSYLRILEAEKNAPESKSDSLPLDEFEKSFKSAMNDDFNTSQAIAHLFDLLTEVNKRLDESNNRPGKQQLVKLLEVLHKTAGDVLGLLPQEEIGASGEDFINIMQLLLDVRDQLRKEKQFALTDKIRDGLNNLGISIKDGPNGSSWERSH